MEEKKEVWKWIEGYEGEYQISNLGRVESVARIDRGGNRIKGRILKPILKSNDYVQVNLQIGKCRYNSHLIQRLVLDAFASHLREEGYQASHLNGNRSDNRLSNLKWESPYDNTQRKKEHGTQHRGEQIRSSKLTSENVLEIRRLRDKKNYSLKRMAKMFDVTISCISSITTRKRWKHI